MRIFNLDVGTWRGALRYPTLCVELSWRSPYFTEVITASLPSSTPRSVLTCLVLSPLTIPFHSTLVVAVHSYTYNIPPSAIESVNSVSETHVVLRVFIDTLTPAPCRTRTPLLQLLLHPLVAVPLSHRAKSSPRCLVDPLPAQQAALQPTQGPLQQPLPTLRLNTVDVLPSRLWV